MKRLVAPLLAVAWVVPLIAQPDQAAKYFHVFPHIGDGDGCQSTLIVTNAAQSANSCTVELNGLTADRFQDAAGITAEGSTATFDLSEPGDHLVWTSKDESGPASGYATIDCVGPVTAQSVFTQDDSMGHPTAIAASSGAQPGLSFQFPVLKKDAILSFAIANISDTDAVCSLGLEDLQEESLGQADLTVPSKTSRMHVLGTAIPIPESFVGGSASLDCDQQVAVLGLHSEEQADGESTAFSLLPAAVVPSEHFQNADGLWSGHWEDSVIVTFSVSGVPYLPTCSGLVGCGGVSLPITAELVQSGAMVTGSVTTNMLRQEMVWTVQGEVSADGTLSLSSDDELTISFSPQSPPTQIRLKSWESRQDTLGMLTGSASVGMFLQGFELVDVKGCLGNGTLAGTETSDVNVLSSACSGIPRVHH